MARSLNKVQLIGNLTRDPELRYTPQGTAVCTFGLATNRTWNTDAGEKKEDVEFHRIVSWQKLAEICSQLLTKGRKVYLEGRLQTRSWTGQDNVAHQTTEIVISDMIILDPKGTVSAVAVGDSFDVPDLPGESPDAVPSETPVMAPAQPAAAGKKSASAKTDDKVKDDKVKDDKAKKDEESEDIPF
jgi:single-strand DNA-binding protein